MDIDILQQCGFAPVNSEKLPIEQSFGATIDAGVSLKVVAGEYPQIIIRGPNEPHP